ncbi:helical backbone metal receptor [Hymenobacter sp. ASUV-10]|uniref:Helical backbone metal receptor n=1 Tax=Hymenobacter aranciens TaxID=3063996 RepID=A0ABT9B6Y1_9BACT|nr:helical backbone metal receptor [Hymenobacter sp. ASUV-10]MDO7874036.1 helical backbone metal receptor [Hymenobacter sp. ASUV-10]
MSYDSHQCLVRTVDQMGRHVMAPVLPQRIVSLVPSQTELLFDLGLGERVVGVTKFCIHPAEARQRATVIGGTKQFDFEKIATLQPDLIIGNKEENYQQGIVRLAADFPVWMSDISTFPKALEMLRSVGQLTKTTERARQLAEDIATSFAALPVDAGLERVAYFIWRKPYMVAGGGTFINDMLARAGFANVFAHLGRYPEITADQLAQAAPEHIFLSSEPYPFARKHVAEFQQICPAATIEIVDGELFSWYGSRLLKSVAYFRQLRSAS